MKTNIILLKTTLIMGLLLLSARAFPAGVYDPDLRWRTLTTEHFLIHYHQGIEPLARRLTVIAEDVHSDLQPRLKWQPASRTHVVLADNTDSANGYSTPFPVNKVVLYVSRPEPDSALGNYSDWLRMVFTHEYTHTLNLDMVTGCCATTRVFPGRIWFPSIFQPVWLLEGNAVYQESRATGMGRNNSTWTDMVMRTEINSGTFKSITLASGFPRSWPRGSVPYLYGGLFVEFLEKYYGNGGVARVYLANSDNKIPYLINSNAREVYGKSFSLLWKEWQSYCTAFYGKDIGLIKSRGITSYKLLSDREERAVLPRFNAGGTGIYYVELSARRGASLIEYSTASGNIRRLCEVYNPISLAVKDDSTVYLSDAALYRSFSVYTEVYRYDGRYRRLTKKLRGKYLDISPDGRSTVYISQSGDRYSLVMDTSAFDSPRPVISRSDIQIAWARFSPDGSRIAFSIKDRRGFCDLMIYSIKNGGFMRLTNDRFNDTAPSWHPQKDTIIFSSDRGGVYNLHEYDLATGEIRQITNMMGGAFSPDISKDGETITFVSYEPGGQAVAVMPYPSKAYEKSVSKEEAVSSDFFTADGDSYGQNGGKSSPYLAFGSMLPRFILPMYWTEEAYRDKYDAAAGFSILGWDVLNRHSYGLSAAYFYDLQKRLVIDAYYTLSAFYPDISLGYYDESIFLGKDEFPYEDENSYTLSRELSRLGYASLYFPLYNISSSQGFRLSYIYEKKMIDDYVAPDTVLSEDIFLGRSQFLYSFSNTESYTYSVSKERGRELLLFGDVYHTGMASDYNFERLAARYNEYLPGFFSNHVTALLLRGAAYIDKPDIIKSFSLGQYTKGSTEMSSDIRKEWGLRGYPGGSDYGCRLAAASLEYRLPLVQSDFAMGLFPVMFRDLWLTAFADFGNVWNDKTEISEFKSSAGIQMHVRFTVGYNLDITAYTGYARGFNRYGEDQFYFAMGTFLNEAIKNSGKRLDYL